jgi:hypothetical protein
VWRDVPPLSSLFSERASARLRRSILQLPKTSVRLARCEWRYTRAPTSGGRDAGPCRCKDRRCATVRDARCTW